MSDRTQPRIGPRAPRDSLYCGEGIYGTFRECRILGYPATITVEEVGSCDPQVPDVSGDGGNVAVGDIAIHISGKDPYGAKTGPGFVRALGIYDAEWDGKHQPNREPHAIISWDESPDGRGHRSDIWKHIAFWVPTDSLVTLRGVLYWWACQYREDRPFKAVDYLRWIDSHSGRSGCMALHDDQQHLRAVGRLLNTSAGVQNNNALDRYLMGNPRTGYWFIARDDIYAAAALLGPIPEPWEEEQPK